MARRKPVTKAEVLAYGKLLAGARRIRVGDTVMLPDGRRVAVLDIINGSLCRVRFESGHTATINSNLLEAQ